jgi:hypothetical protein
VTPIVIQHVVHRIVPRICYKITRDAGKVRHASVKGRRREGRTCKERGRGVEDGEELLYVEDEIGVFVCGSHPWYLV